MISGIKSTLSRISLYSHRYYTKSIAPVLFSIDNARIFSSFQNKHYSTVSHSDINNKYSLSITKDPVIDHYLGILDSISENLHTRRPKTLYHIISLINDKILPLIESTDKSKIPNIEYIYSTVFGCKLYSQFKLKHYVEAIKTLSELEKFTNIDENILYIVVSRISKLPNCSESIHCILDWIACYNSSHKDHIMPTCRLLVAIMSCLRRITDLHLLLPLYELFKELPNPTPENISCLLWIAIKSRNYPLLRIYLSDLPKILDNNHLIDIPPAVYCQIIENLEPTSQHIDTAMMALELYCNHPLSRLNIRILKAATILAEKNRSIPLAKMILSKAKRHEFVGDVYSACMRIAIIHLNNDPNSIEWIISLLKEMEPISAYSIEHLCSIIDIITTSEYRQYMIDIINRHLQSNVIFHISWMIQRILNPIDDNLSNPDELLSKNGLPVYKDNILHFQSRLALAIMSKSSVIARNALMQQLNICTKTPQLSLSTIPILIKSLFQHHVEDIYQLNQSKQTLLHWISNKDINTVLLTKLITEIRSYGQRDNSLDQNILSLYESIIIELNRTHV